jgi:hypothetical protein
MLAKMVSVWLARVSKWTNPSTMMNCELFFEKSLDIFPKPGQGVPAREQLFPAPGFGRASFPDLKDAVIVLHCYCT